MEDNPRPIGVSILAILHLAGGVIGESVFIYRLDLDMDIPIFGLSPALILGVIILFFSLVAVSGIGLWKGKKWGWYIAGLFYLYGILRNGLSLIIVPLIPLLMETVPVTDIIDMSRGPVYYYSRHGISFAVYFLIYIYLFKNNVREFFSLATQKKWKLVFIELGMISAIGVIFIGFIASIFVVPMLMHRGV